MTRALLIEPGNDHATLIEVDGSDLPAMQKLVGGWLEGLPLPDVGALALINEDGKLQGLPVNSVASHVAWGAGGLDVRDVIQGPMVIVSVGGAGKTGDVPEHLLAAVRAAGVEIREEQS